MPGRNTPLPQHMKSQTPAGAIPATPSIAQIEQEQLAPQAVLVIHNGPITTHELPARAGAAFSQICSTTSTQVIGKDLKRKRAILLSTDNPFYYSSREISQVNSASAALWPINVPLVLQHGDEVWVACATASMVSTIAVVTENFDGGSGA